MGREGCCDLQLTAPARVLSPQTPWSSTGVGGTSLSVSHFAAWPQSWPGLIQVPSLRPACWPRHEDAGQQGAGPTHRWRGPQCTCAHGLDQARAPRCQGCWGKGWLWLAGLEEVQEDFLRSGVVLAWRRGLGHRPSGPAGQYCTEDVDECQLMPNACKRRHLPQHRGRLQLRVVRLDGARTARENTLAAAPAPPASGRHLP